MRVVTVALIAALAIGCGSASSPTGPTISTGISGTWIGQAADASGPGTMTWRITASGDSFSGTVTAVEASTRLTGRGTVSGTTSGVPASLDVTFSMDFPEGGFDSPYESCTAPIAGSGHVSGSEFTGSYAGTNSCTGEVASGQLTLIRQ